MTVSAGYQEAPIRRTIPLETLQQARGDTASRKASDMALQSTQTHTHRHTMQQAAGRWTQRRYHQWITVVAVERFPPLPHKGVETQFIKQRRAAEAMRLQQNSSRVYTPGERTEMRELLSA